MSSDMLKTQQFKQRIKRHGEASLPNLFPFINTILAVYYSSHLGNESKHVSKLF